MNDVDDLAQMNQMYMGAADQVGDDPDAKMAAAMQQKEI